MFLYLIADSYCSLRVNLLERIVKFLEGKRKFRQRRAKISADISAHLFGVTCNKLSGLQIHRNSIVDVTSWTEHSSNTFKTCKNISPRYFKRRYLIIYNYYEFSSGFQDGAISESTITPYGRATKPQKSRGP